MKIALLEPIGVSKEVIDELSAPITEKGHEFVYYDTKTNFKIISYDKIGLKYKHLRNASRKVMHISAAFNYTSLTLEQLWSIYFEIYTYIEKLLVYSKEFKKDLIDAIYQNC